MVDKLKIFQICPTCRGRLVIDTSVPTEGESSDPNTTTEIECPDCEGIGEVEWGRMEEVEE